LERDITEIGWGVGCRNKRLLGPTYEYGIAKPVQEYLDEQLKRALLEK